MKPIHMVGGLAAVLVGVVLVSGAACWAAEMRLGIIGTDTSHAVAFTELLNDLKAKDHVPGARVVGAFKGGSPDLEASWSRVEPNARLLQERYGVRFYDSIPALCEAVEAVLLLSVDGRPHLEQVKPVLTAKKAVYIDKPMAASLRDVLTIFDLARDAGVPVFSASSLRFGRATQAARRGQVGTILHAETTSPCPIEPHHPDLFWYGIHGVESLFTVMGTGVESVQHARLTNGWIEVTGRWRGGRTGVYRQSMSYGGLAKGDKGEMAVGAFDGYAPLVAEIVRFFQTGVAPVPAEETIEIFAFMEAADESKRRGGGAVRIQEVLDKARH